MIWSWSLCPYRWIKPDSWCIRTLIFRRTGTCLSSRVTVSPPPMAPWSPLIWRRYKMQRVVQSTLVTQTHSFLNGLGHAESTAAHLVDMRCRTVDVAQRFKDLPGVQLHCVVAVKSLYDKLLPCRLLHSRWTKYSFFRSGHYQTLNDQPWSHDTMAPQTKGLCGHVA